MFIYFFALLSFWSLRIWFFSFLFFSGDPYIFASVQVSGEGVTVRSSGLSSCYFYLGSYAGEVISYFGFFLTAACYLWSTFFLSGVSKASIEVSFAVQLDGDVGYFNRVLGRKKVHGQWAFSPCSCPWIYFVPRIPSLPSVFFLINSFYPFFSSFPTSYPLSSYFQSFFGPF